mgnify:CR=1 FL=1
MVGTEDLEIAEIAESCSLKVPFLRWVEIAGHHATTVQVLYEVLAQYRTAGRCFDLACCLYPTAAFVRPKDLSDGRAALVAGDFDVFMPVAEFDSSVWQSLRRDRGGKISPNFSEMLIFARNTLKKPIMMPDNGIGLQCLNLIETAT